MSKKTNLSQNGTPRRRSRKKVVLAGLLVVTLLFGGAGYAATRFMNGPAVGTVVQTLPANVRREQVELKQFDAAQFTVAVPVTYVEQTVRRQPTATDLESRTLVSSGMTSKVLTAVVTKLPSNKVEDDPSYSLRMQDKAKYQLRELVLKNEKVSVFTSQDSQQLQQVAFWPHQGKLLTLTLSGVATDVETAKAEYQGMLDTLAWR